MRLYDHGMTFALAARDMPLWKLIAEISTSFLEGSGDTAPGRTIEPQLTDIWFDENTSGLYRVTFTLWIESARWEITALAPTNTPNGNGCVMIHAGLRTSIDGDNLNQLNTELKRFFRALTSVLLSRAPTSGQPLPVGHGDAPDDYVEETINP